MDLTLKSQTHSFHHFQIECLPFPDESKGALYQLFHDEQWIGELTVHLAPRGLKDDALLTFLDDIELIAVHLYDVAQDQKRISNQIKQSPFGYLTNLKIHPDYQNQGIGSYLLTHVIQDLANAKIPNLYLVSVADTSHQQQKLHHFFMHHYFTYLVPQHPHKPAVMHLKIED